MTQRAVIQLTVKIMQHRDAIRAGLQRKDPRALAVVNAYGLWYDAPSDPGAFGMLQGALDAFIVAHRRTVLA